MNGEMTGEIDPLNPAPVPVALELFTVDGCLCAAEFDAAAGGGVSIGMVLDCWVDCIVFVGGGGSLAIGEAEGGGDEDEDDTKLEVVVVVVADEEEEEE